MFFVKFNKLYLRKHDISINWLNGNIIFVIY